MKSTFIGLLKASHFGPTVLVVSISFFLSLSNFSAFKSFEIACAILFGQFVVGWSNDLIDFSADQAAGRNKKPLVAGLISKNLLKKSIFIASLVALTLSIIGPLGIQGSIIHFLGILSATAYNVKLKQTILSPLPYIVSFGAMPWAVYRAVGNNPPLWLYLGFALFAVAFHFLNVLKDLDADLLQGIRGLPQRLGKRWSISIAIALGIAGVIDIALR
jgi:4-hydroxybenzoate polyprenyltransferase